MRAGAELWLDLYKDILLTLLEKAETAQERRAAPSEAAELANLCHDEFSERWPGVSL